jgi:ABC-type lipoprotein export system ATPase subunit
MLYAVHPLDPLTLGVAVVAVAAASAGGHPRPAPRALTVDPAHALRGATEWRASSAARASRRASRIAGGRRLLLRRIDLDVAEGDFSLRSWGPRGGQDDALNVLGLHDAISRREYALDGHAVHALARRERMDLQKKTIGFVFQSYHLLDDLTVAENLDLPLSYRGLPGRAAGLVADTLDRFGIVGKKDLYPRQLSGGSSSSWAWRAR